MQRIERDLPADAEVFELPYRYFPEAPQMGTLGPYDLVRPYLHSDSLKWSFGGMLGRDADWQASATEHAARQMLDRVAAIGFDGLLYDTGSAYNGGTASVDDISAVLGQTPRLGGDLELAFWDLRDYRPRAPRPHRRRRHPRPPPHTLADRSEPASSRARARHVISEATPRRRVERSERVARQEREHPRPVSRLAASDE